MASGPGGALLALAYGHDDAGQITGVVANRAKESWSYTQDDLDRLTEATTSTTPR